MPCLHSQGNKKLLTPQTLMSTIIGLPIITALQPHADVYVQLKGRRNDTQIPVHPGALNPEPDLAQIPQQMQPQVLQSVYAATGYDYVSYFRGIGKVFFLNAFSMLLLLLAETLKAL